MAAALFADQVRAKGCDMEIASAGTAALIGHPPPDTVIEILKERDIDISSHRARQVTGEMARHYDLILVMERSQQQFIEGNWPIFKGRVHHLVDSDKDVTDPYGSSTEVYMDSLAQIESGVDKWSTILFS